MNVNSLTKSIQSAFIGLVALTALPIMADTGTSNAGTGDAILTQQVDDPFRKRMPSTMTLQLIYQDGMVSISSDHYIGAFSLSFENYETGATYAVPSIQIGESISIALEIGEYQLTATGEDGTTLSGFMQVY